MGGIIGLVGQWLTIRAAANERTISQREGRKALGYAVWIKLLRIHGNLRALNSALVRAAGTAEKERLELWQALLPLANFPDEVRFVTEELALLLSFGDSKLFAGCLSSDEAHNSAIEALRNYSRLRQALTLDMRVDEMAGPVGSAKFTAAEMAAFRGRMYEVNSIALSMQRRLKADEDEALTTLLQVQEIFRTELDLNTQAVAPTSQNLGDALMS